MPKTLSTGTDAHNIPTDLRRTLQTNPEAVTTWENITPLARNEWICWVVSVKQQKTRDEHIVRAVRELAQGKRRPCCWMGCIHRSDKPMSASQKFIASR